MLSSLIISILVLTVILGVVSCWRPGIALALVWSMFGLEQVLQVRFLIFLENSWIVNVSIGACCLIAVINIFFITKFEGYRIPTALFLYLCLISLCCLSYYWCVEPKTTFAELKKNLPHILTFVVLAPLCIYRPKEMVTTVKVMIFFGGLILLAMFFGNFGSRGLVLDYVRHEAIEANSLAASQFAGYVGICAIFSIYAKKHNMIEFGLKIAIGMLAIYLIIRSGSRGQLIAFAATCFLVLPFTVKLAAKRSTIVALVFAFVVVLTGIMIVDGSRWSTRWQVEHMVAARDGRLGRNIELLEHYAEGGPMTWSVGLGSSASFKLVDGYPHNIPNETLTEEGLLGFCLLVGIVLVTIRESTKTMNSRAETLDRVNCGILLALFVFDALLSLKQGTLLGSVPMFSFAITMGWMAVLIRKKPRRQIRFSQPHPPMPIQY